jgi:hypothetical protein
MPPTIRATTFTRAGQCLAAGALMAGLALAASPTASGDSFDNLVNCMGKGNTASDCCVWGGGTFTSHPGGGWVCVQRTEPIAFEQPPDGPLRKVVIPPKVADGGLAPPASPGFTPAPLAPNSGRG